MPAATVPNIEDPDVRNGDPVFSWDGDGLDAWWKCRLCRQVADRWHLNSEKHKRNVASWEDQPADWVYHFEYYYEDNPCKPKPFSPPSTLDQDDAPPPPPGLVSAAEVQSLRDEVQNLRVEFAALQTLEVKPLLAEVQGLRTELEALRAEVGQVAQQMQAGGNIQTVMGQIVGPAAPQMTTQQ